MTEPKSHSHDKPHDKPDEKAHEKPPAAQHEGGKDEPKEHKAPERKAPQHKDTQHKAPAAKAAHEKSGKAAPKAPHVKKAGAKPTGKPAPKAAAGKKPAPSTKQDVKIVEKPTLEKHKALAKPTLTGRQRDRLRLRAAIASRRPRFRRQQWYEYRRLADSGWRKPTGIDSAMRRHFGYEQNVVRIGFRGPVEVRGLHPSGFREVRVEHVEDLGAIDPKTQAARVSGNLGARTLKLVYAEADKRGIRVLNRRKLE